MNKQKTKKLYLLTSLICLLFAGSSIAATTTTPNHRSQHFMQLAHDLGYPHYHGDTTPGYSGSGRIRSYSFCSRTVFEPCIRNGGSYRYCNGLHHRCTYGNLRNCIQGETC